MYLGSIYIGVRFHVKNTHTYINLAFFTEYLVFVFPLR